MSEQRRWIPRAAQTLRLAPQAAVIAVHAYEVPFEGKLRLAGVERGTIDAYRYRAAEKAIAEIRTVGERAAGKRARQPQSRLRLCASLDPQAGAVAPRRRSHRPGQAQTPALQEFLLDRVTRHVLADSRSDVLVVPTL